MHRLSSVLPDGVRFSLPLSLSLSLSFYQLKGPYLLLSTLQGKSGRYLEAERKREEALARGSTKVGFPDALFSRFLRFWVICGWADGVRIVRF